MYSVVKEKLEAIALESGLVFLGFNRVNLRAPAEERQLAFFPGDQQRHGGED